MCRARRARSLAYSPVSRRETMCHASSITSTERPANIGASGPGGQRARGLAVRDRRLAHVLDDHEHHQLQQLARAAAGVEHDHAARPRERSCRGRAGRRRSPRRRTRRGARRGARSIEASSGLSASRFSVSARSSSAARSIDSRGFSRRLAAQRVHLAGSRCRAARARSTVSPSAPIIRPCSDFRKVTFCSPTLAGSGTSHGLIAHGESSAPMSISRRARRPAA